MEIFEDCVQEVVITKQFCDIVKAWTELFGVNFPDIIQLKRIAHNINMMISKMKGQLVKCGSYDEMVAKLQPVIRNQDINDFWDIIKENIFVDIQIEYLRKVTAKIDEERIQYVTEAEA